MSSGRGHRKKQSTGRPWNYYDLDVLRLMSIFKDHDLYVGSVVITKYSGQESASLFKKRLEKLGIKVYRHYIISGYPSNIPHIVSEEGYGKNDYIETTKPLIVVTAPGPGTKKWQSVSPSSTTNTKEESVQDTQNSRHFRFGIYR